jgi:hypothetical protein
MSKSKSRTKSRIAVAGVATGGVVALVLGGTAVPAMAAVAVTLSSSSGPSGGGNVLTAASASATAFPLGVTPNVQFQAVTATSTACSASWKAPLAIAASATTPFATTAGVVGTDPADVKRLSTTKIVFTVPSAVYPSTLMNATGLALVGSQISSRWYLCVYDGTHLTTSTLLANSTYSIATQPTINSASGTGDDDADGLNPLTGPALGGTTITLNGTGFTTGSTVTVGGTPATGVTVNTAGTLLTAVTPAHTAGAGLPVIVNTTGGRASTLDPDGDGDAGDMLAGYSYSNGVIVTPNTAPAESELVDLDVQGVGFSTMEFNDDPTEANAAAVRLVTGAYAKASNRGPAACMDYMVISDTEVICTMDLTDKLVLATSVDDTGSVAVGTYTITVVGDEDDDATASEITSGSTFTVAPY